MIVDTGHAPVRVELTIGVDSGERTVWVEGDCTILQLDLDQAEALSAELVRVVAAGRRTVLPVVAP